MGGLKWMCDKPHSLLGHLVYAKYPDGFSDHNSTHMFDAYSLTHVFWGMVTMAAVLIILPHTRFKDWLKPKPILIAFIVGSILFELGENAQKSIMNANINMGKGLNLELDSNGLPSYNGDSLLNIFGDTLCNVAGAFWIFRYPQFAVPSILAVMFAVFAVFGVKIGGVILSRPAQFVRSGNAEEAKAKAV